MVIILFFITIQFPMEVHGYGWIGKYSGLSKRYNIDATIDLYADLFKFGDLHFSIEYRHDLDMASGQEEGVTFDPKFLHYYIIPGLDLSLNTFIFTGRLIHDCVHFVDIENPSAPVFNRIRLGIMSTEHHLRNFLKREPILSWRIEYGFYPQWQFYKWMNWGTDYRHDFLLEVNQSLFQYRSISLRAGLFLDFNHRMWGGFYHNHRIRAQGCYRTPKGTFNIFYDYYLYVNDPLKAPNRLGILCLGLQF
ncbi:MAG: hypothetical protein NC826_04570 [Candidatus Omnitrophica bacterium]|nr:hypothetical protein [Candidatus Omnitrophota bacterium]